MTAGNLCTSQSRYTVSQLCLMLWICLMVRLTLRAERGGDSGWSEGKRIMSGLRDTHVRFMAQDSSKGYYLYRVYVVRNNQMMDASVDHTIDSDLYDFAGDLYYKKADQDQCYTTEIYSSNTPDSQEEYDCNAIDKKLPMIDAQGHSRDMISWKTPIQDVDRIWDFDVTDVLEIVQKGIGSMIPATRYTIPDEDHLMHEREESFHLVFRSAPRAIVNLPLRASDPSPLSFRITSGPRRVANNIYGTLQHVEKERELPRRVANNIYGTLQHVEKERELVWSDAPGIIVFDRRPLWLRRAQQSPVPAFYGEIKLKKSIP